MNWIFVPSMPPWSLSQRKYALAAWYEGIPSRDRPPESGNSPPIFTTPPRCTDACPGAVPVVPPVVVVPVLPAVPAFPGTDVVSGAPGEADAPTWSCDSLNRGAHATPKSSDATAVAANTRREV